MNTPSIRFPEINSCYQEADAYVPAETPDRLPRIGLSANRKEDGGLSCIAEPYFQSVLLAGGAPVLIPVMTDIRALEAVVAELDGLIFSGGGDVDPRFFSQDPVPELDGVDPFRDTYDFLLLRLAFNRQLPIMGICRGHQLINVAFGGTLYQDIHTRFSEAALRHSQSEPRDCATHTVALAAIPSRLRTLLKDNDRVVQVNSLHHQAVNDVAPEFITTATAPDGVIEAIEHPEYPLFGVQWHPEQMAVKGNEEMTALFRHLVRQAHTFAEAKRLHEQILTVDSHTDTPMVYAGAFDLGKRIGGAFNAPFTESKMNLPLMECGHLDATFMVAYVPQGERTATAYEQVWEYTQERLSQLLRQEQLHPSRVGIARTCAEALQLKQERRKALFLAVENGYAIGTDLARLQRLKAWGVSYLTLCHNGANDICDAATGAPEWNGLSAFGRSVVGEMNRLGIMVDVSHASEATFYDVLNASAQPVIASHSSVRALCNHPRNLTDDQIRALAARGGVVQICLYTGFIRTNSGETGCPAATLSDALRHIHHVVRLVGVDHVGIGSDFDGGGELIGCRAANELIQITVRLLEDGFSDQEIQKIWGGNLMRVMQTVQQAATAN
jgi:microsomal dipeptidase-like Zn-dependent dipeptidase/gamma-glutamyl-gamma-aminobutyrate hydrolase PuuD